MPVIIEMIQINRDLLIGSWRLISAKFTCEGEDPVSLWGKEPVGYLFYTEHHMSATLTQVPPLPSAPQLFQDADQEELAQAVRYLAYVGTYTITPGAILHHVEACTLPLWIGQEHTRFVEELTGETLVLRCPPMRILDKERTGFLRWRKV